MSDSQNMPEDNNTPLSEWFTTKPDVPIVDSPTPSTTYKPNIMTEIVSEMNASMEDEYKLTNEEINQVSVFIRKMEKSHPNVDMDITQLMYFIKHINHSTDDTKSVEHQSEEVKEENEEILEELSEDESEEVKEEEEEEESDEEEENEEEEKKQEEEEEEEEEEDDDDKQFMYNKDMPTILNSNISIDIPFPITCTFTILMTLYSVQLGLLFCRLIGCNYLEHSHDEL